MKLFCREIVLGAVSCFFFSCSMAPPTNIPALNDNNSNTILTTTQGIGWGGEKDSNYISRSPLGKTPLLRLTWMPSVTYRSPVERSQADWIWSTPFTSWVSWVSPYVNAVGAGSALGL